MKTSTRLVGLLGLMLASLSASAATVVVTVGVLVGGSTNNYSPRDITIRPGDRVRWEWQSGTYSTVSDSAPPLWQPFTISSANTSFTSQPLTSPGTFNYYCSLHSSVVNGVRTGMVGSITVSNAPSATLDAKAAATALSVYPNPSKGLVVVTVNHKVGPEYKLRLTNVLGREIRSFILRPEASNTGMPLNLSDLPSGMYFYSLVLNDKVVSTKRFVLQN